MNPQRHHLIYVDSNAVFALYSLHADKNAMEQQVVAWLAKGLPCVYAKQLPDVKNIRLGLPFFYENKKHRIGISIDPAEILKQEPLPQLIAMQDFFMRCYGIKSLVEPQLENIAVYGSFLFHYLSGRSYVDESSDLDLLIDYQGHSLVTLREVVNELARKFNRTIDGEVRFKQLGDIPLKELLDLSAQQLLCKGPAWVKLLSRIELYEQYNTLL